MVITMNRRGFLRAAVATVALTTGLATTRLDKVVKKAAPIGVAEANYNKIMTGHHPKDFWNDDALRKWYVEAQARAYADAREDAVYDAVYNALINSPS